MKYAVGSHRSFHRPFGQHNENQQAFVTLTVHHKLFYRIYMLVSSV